MQGMVNLFGFWGKGIGIDLGTANTLIYVAGRGIVVNNPSVIAVNSKTNNILAVGNEAKNMLGRTPIHVKVIKPVTGGVISDFDMTQEMIRHYLKSIGNGKMLYRFQKAVVGVPSNLTEVERKSVEDALLVSGVSKVYIVEEPLAAALGARLPINEPAANMVIDIGGGTTDIAVISMGGVVTSRSLKVAGDKMSEDIIRFVRDEFKVLIGEPTAELLKTEIGAAMPQEQKLEMPVRGRDLTTGLPKEIVVRDSHIRSAIAQSLKEIVDTIKEVIEKTPPELAGDVLKKGVHLCGGGSLLKDLDRLISKELGVEAFLVDDPLSCVVRGTGVLVENIEKYKEIFHDPLTPKDVKV